MRLVFLIGPRGSGKSTVGRVLAGRLGWDFADADVWLEERAGLTIREIFEREGEAGFRERETAMLRDLAEWDGHVIATGGGVVLRAENRELLQRGAIVYLTADVDTLWRRACADATTAQRRPALLGGGRDEVARVVAAREGLYRECAHLVVATGDRTPEEVAGEIAGWLAGR